MPTLKLGLREIDRAVDEIGVRRGHLDAHAAEQLQGGEAGVCGADVALAVLHPRVDGVQVLQDLILENQVFRMGDSDAVNVELPERLRVLLGVVARVLVHLHVQEELSGHGDGVGLEDVVVLGEVVIAEVAEVRGSAHGLILERELGAVIPYLHTDIGQIRPEIFRECTPLGERIAQTVNGILLAEMDQVVDGDLASLDTYVAGDLGVVVADVFEVVLDVLNGGLDCERTVNDRRRADLSEEFGHAGLLVRVSPVVDAHEGIPAEKGGIGLLLDVLVETARVEFLGVGDLDGVLGQAVLPFGDDPRGAAGHREHQYGQEGREQSVGMHSHLFTNHTNLAQFFFKAVINLNKLGYLCMVTLYAAAHGPAFQQGHQVHQGACLQEIPRRDRSVRRGR